MRQSIEQGTEGSWEQVFLPLQSWGLSFSQHVDVFTDSEALLGLVKPRHQYWMRDHREFDSGDWLSFQSHLLKLDCWQQLEIIDCIAAKSPNRTVWLKLKCPGKLWIWKSKLKQSPEVVWLFITRNLIWMEIHLFSQDRNKAI